MIGQVVGRLLRVIGTVLVIAVAFVTPVLATSAPATADTVVNGCTIVANPASKNFTNCPGADLSSAHLSGVNLSFANLAAASFANCTRPMPPAVGICSGADLSGANLSNANLARASFATCTPYPHTPPGKGCFSTNLSGVNLTHASLSGATFFSCFSHVGCGAATLNEANLTDANLSYANVAGCYFFICPSDLSGATLTGANLTGIFCEVVPPGSREPLTSPCLVPTENFLMTTNGTGAVATWVTPVLLPGATPGSCTSPSGSTFPLGVTTVTCQVFDDHGDVATGTFTVAVCSTTSSCNLKGANLTDVGISADLVRANLSGATLTGDALGSDDLAGANLSRATLTCFKLFSGYLQCATLFRVDLAGANLSGANLTGAVLQEVNLTGANLNKAILTGVHWYTTTCPDGTNSDNDGNTCVGHR
jgi:uncharacterized protein YjbI with pentapeptide repeats